MDTILQQTSQIKGAPVDYIIVGVYFIGILLFGAYFSKYSKTTKDFFFGGQRFAWWLIAASLVATGIGSYSFLKYAQAGFSRGMSSTMTYLNDWLMIPLFMFGWLPIIYFSRVKSIPEYFERRFDRKTRLIATILTLLYLIGYIGLNFFLLGTAMKALLGIDMYVAVIVVAIISAIYVTVGGQTAVIFTDLVQGFFLYLAGAILVILGLKAVGGMSGWWGSMDIAHRLPFPGFNRPADFNYAGVFWSEGIIGTLAFTFVNQGFIMRYLAVKNVNEGRKCLTFNTLILMPISAIVVANVGWIGYSLFMQDKLPIAENFDTRDIFIRVAEDICKPGVFGFVIAALTAALMSTVDTLINACTAIGVYDVYQTWMVKKASDKHYLNVSRVLSFVITILGVCLVPIFANQASIFKAHYAFVAMVGPAMLIPILFGVVWKKFTPGAAFVSMILGIIVTLVSIWVPDLAKPLAMTHGMSDGKQMIVTWHTTDTDPWPKEIREHRSKSLPEGAILSPEHVIQYNLDAANRNKPFGISAQEVRVQTEQQGQNTLYSYAAAMPELEAGKTYTVRVSGAKGYGRASKDVRLTVPAGETGTPTVLWQINSATLRPENITIDRLDAIPGEPSSKAFASATTETNPFALEAETYTWDDTVAGKVRHHYAATLTGLEPKGTKYAIRVGDKATHEWSWDITFKTAGDYGYFRGVLGLAVMIVLAFALNPFFKPKREEEIVGLTIWTIQEQRGRFKGGKPNDARGTPVKAGLLVEGESNLLHLSRKMMETLKAKVGDLMYVADGRWYLGGLRSIHIHLGEPHDQGDVVLLSQTKVEEGDLHTHKPVRVEKVL